MTSFNSLYRSLYRTLVAALFPAVALSAAANTPLLGIEAEEYSSIGIYVYDLRADSVVVASDAQRVVAPASVMKALTAASVMELKPQNFRFETPVYLTGARHHDNNRVWCGDIVIKSCGDPTIDSRHLRSGHGLADSIVSAVRKLGIDSIAGDILVDESLSDYGPVPQWEIDDVAWGYGAGLYGFNYRDNTLTVHPATGVTDPHDPSLDLTLIHQRNGSNQLRGIFSDNLVVFGSNLDNPKWAITTTMPNPSAVFSYHLSQRLKEANIVLADESIANEHTQFMRLYTHYSAPLDQILHSMMVRSDNLYAEGMLRSLAPGGRRADAIEHELSLWKSRGLETDYINVRDGSGLSRVNRMSAQFMGSLLRQMLKSKNANRYVSLFPIAGKEGTVRSFMQDTPLSGHLALKTGSMNGVQCYAGYALDDNGAPTHVVVMLANNFFCSRAELREAFGKLLLEKIKF